jgi:hypothetical protein
VSPRPAFLIAPATLTLHDISADGRVVHVHETGRVGILALAPGEGRPRDASWLDYSLVRHISADGRTVLFVEGGRGGGASYAVFVSGDGAAYACSYHLVLSELNLADGLR